MQNAQTTQQFSQFKTQLKEQFGPAIYDSYFDRLSLVESSDEQVTLCAPTRFSASLISQRYLVRMRQMWSDSISPVKNLDIKGAPELGMNHASASAADASAPKPAARRMPVSTRRADQPRGAKPAKAQRPSFDAEGAATFAQGMTLDRFRTNETNSLAYRAAMKVLEAQSPSVTTIHGAAGRGKTHLLNAVGQEWLRQRPNDNVLYLTYDALMADMCEAFISKSYKELRSFLQNTDMLLVDDIHLLRGRKRTMEELDCLIDRLKSAGKQVMVAGALPPSKMAETGVSPRLASRLAGGLCVAMGKPDLALRTKIAKQFAEEAADSTGTAVPTRHLDFIARRCEDSVRELEGALSLVQVAAEARADFGGELDDESVRTLLSDHLSKRKPQATPEAILDFTVKTFDLAKDELMGRSRKQPIVRARHAFCFAVRKLTDTPLTAIGSMIGRDHTTVMHSIRTAEILAGSDATFGTRISEIFDEFGRD
ncbi:DnaA ATPase domain-containing protein [Parvularcula maris]|uniref:Chromosomal replication initiator protein DnaA n=1 Tax=Parvularcula maris TaxID=2965077 RepID=A0A9X2L8A6_9PROT|nr:DnaA/Hda family protein [Parvularcula maris]MCQ8184779.1 DnaA/Hda family protein [Parvularcula maris]